MTWSIQQIWNQQLVAEPREPKVRDYISASDVGGSFLDRYYKMTGVKPSNDYDERTLRIFDAGKAWEQLVVRIFRMAGIMQDYQGSIEIPENKDHLKVIGYLDAVVGGKPDADKAKAMIDEYIHKFGLKAEDEFLENRALKLIEFLQEKYPEGLASVVAEIKSVNSMAFWAHKNQGSDGYFKGYDHHKLQLLTYLLGQPKDHNGEIITAGRLFYISKDDLCLQETGVYMSEDLVKLWEEDVKQMSYYFRNKIVPEREPDVVWNNNEKRFEVNWKMARSPYLTLITGLSKEEWEAQAEAVVRARNLEEKWKMQAKEHGFSIDGMSVAEIKKECMRRNRELKKNGQVLLEERESEDVLENI